MPRDINFIIDHYPGMNTHALQEDILKAAFYGNLEDIRSAVAECPKSVNFVDAYTGGSALHMSAGLGNLSCAEFLVTCEGIDLFLEDGDGKTALDRAMDIQHFAIADLLADKMFPNRKSTIGFPELNA